MLVLSRQDIPTLDRTRLSQAVGCARGAYVLRESSATPRAILIGTGTELHLCLQAAERLEAAGCPTRVVSMPSMEVFTAQDDAYRESVLPNSVTQRVAVEAGTSLGWHRWIGPEGKFIGVDGFGLSAPAPTLYAHFGITVDRIVAAAS
jgi:transketolase